VRYNLPLLVALVLVTRSDSLGTEFEMLGSLDAQLLLGFTFFAFQSKDNLARSLGLLVKDGLGLSAKSHLLAVVPTLALRKVARLAGLVLCHLVVGVLLALTCTVGLAFLGDIDHVCRKELYGLNAVKRIEDKEVCEDACCSSVKMGTIKRMSGGRKVCRESTSCIETRSPSEVEASGRINAGKNGSGDREPCPTRLKAPIRGAADLSLSAPFR